MGITEILRRIWLLSANEIQISESVSKKSTQLELIEAEIGHKSVQCFIYKIGGFHTKLMSF